MKSIRQSLPHAVVLPAALLAGVALAVLTGSGSAAADPSNGPTNGSDSAGSRPIHDAVEEFGQSLCPKLVKPGSDLATAVSEMKGNSGLGPTVTGMITGLAIQLECPAFMSSVADGKLPEALQKAGDSPIGPLLQIPALGEPATAPKKPSG